MNRSTFSFNRIHAFAALLLLALATFFAACAPAPIPVTSGNSVNKPASAVQAKPDVDLGAGYRLVTSAQGVHIVAPETVVRPANKTYDLGAGYTLEIIGDYGHIIPPSSGYQPKAPDAVTKKEYIGGGFWLVTGPDGGQIIQGDGK